ncbi:hypothetical protein SAMN04490206_2043 [Pseudomonas umsongensis]|nr:hypothetical protein SAMN04490206_2043 [Pseudomonas umsongensis]
MNVEKNVVSGTNGRQIKRQALSGIEDVQQR